MTTKHMLTIQVPSVPFGPEGIPKWQSDADYYRAAANSIRHYAALGEAFAGSNVTESVAQLCERVHRTLIEQDESKLNPADALCMIDKTIDNIESFPLPWEAHEVVNMLTELRGALLSTGDIREALGL